MLCHTCTTSSLGPVKTGRESQVMSLGLAHPWQAFKLPACLGVDDIHLQLFFVNVQPSEDSGLCYFIFGLFDPAGYEA